MQATPEIGKSIRAGGVLTNYHEAGKGTPVILIHGCKCKLYLGENHTIILVSKLSQQLDSFRADQDSCCKTTSLKFAFTLSHIRAESVFSFFQV